MSVLTGDRQAAYEQAYTRADINYETVIIYLRYVTGNEGDEIVPQYIVTGIESETPTGATIETVIDPERTPLYDYAYRQGYCC